MTDPDQQRVCAWIDAYYSGRDDDLVALAHPDVEIHPRAGMGDRLYVGVAGVRKWLTDTSANRSRIVEFTTGLLPDGRVLAESSLDGTPVCAIFELRDERIVNVAMYVSDPEMLRHIGRIQGVPDPMSRQAVTDPQHDAPAS